MGWYVRAYQLDCARAHVCATTVKAGMDPGPSASRIVCHGSGSLGPVLRFHSHP